MYDQNPKKPNQPDDDIDDYLSRYTRKRVREEAQKQGVDPDLAERQFGQESAYKPDVIKGQRRSSAGAIGAGQLMPGTAKDLGVDPYHIDENISGSVRYMKQQLDAFGGDKAAAAAAYNWGPGNVKKYGLSNAPAETRNYVKNVAGQQKDDVDEFLSRWKEPPVPRVSPFDETEDQAKARRAGMTPAQRKEDRRQTIGAMQNELVESSRIMQQPTPPSGKATAGVFGQSQRQATADAKKQLTFRPPGSTYQGVIEEDVNRLNRRAAISPQTRQRADKIARAKTAYDQLPFTQQMAARALATIGGANEQDVQAMARPDTLAESALAQPAQAAIRGTADIVRGVGELPLNPMMPYPSNMRPVEQVTKPAAAAINRGAGVAAPIDETDKGWLTAKIPAAIGSAVPFIAGNAATGGGAGSAALLGAMGSMGQYAEQIDQSGQQVSPMRRASGQAVAMAQGLTEAFGLGRVLDKFGVKQPAVTRIAEMLEEAGQEYVQQYLEDINAKLVAAYDQSRDLSPFEQNKLEAAALGAIVGGAFQGGSAAAEAVTGIPERRNIQQIQAERAPMPGIAPSVPAGTQTQVTRITPEAARAANQPVAPSVTPDIANAPTEPLTEPIATNQIPSEAIPAPSQPNAPLFPAAQQAEQDISQLQGFDKLAALEARRRGTAKTTPEQALNKEFERLNALAESPDEADRKEAAKGYNRLLTKIRGSQQYAAETRGGVTETPYRNARQVIEQRLQGLAKPKPQKAATPAVASQSAQLPDLLTQAEWFKQDAVAAEQAGNFEAAAIAYQSARDILRTVNTRHGKTMAAPDLAALRQDINLQHGAFQNAQKQARDLQKQANKTTAGLPQPRHQAAQQPPPLMRSGAIVNPEGGIPAQAPKMTFTEELQRGIDQSDAARARRKPGKRLVAKIAELGGISEEYRGELQSVADARRIGVIRKKPALSPDILAEQLREDGYDVDPNDLNTLWRAIDEDISSERGFRPADSAALDRRLAEEEAAYYEQQASRPQSQQLRQDTGELAPEADEDMAALRRAKERSERENPREYGERTRPGEPAGISFSDYSVLQSRNAKAEQALYDSAPGSSRFKAAEAAIRQDAQQIGIAPRHVDAMVAYALNYHSEKAFWAERGLDLDKIQNPVEAAEAYVESVREEVRNATARLSGSERTEIEREVAAIDEVFNDPDMVELLDRAADGDQDAANDFKQLGVDYYGLKPETASELVRSRQEDRKQAVARSRQSTQATAPSQTESASTRSDTRQAARQLTADERRLIQTRPVEVFDQDFDDYTRKVESLYAQAVRGEVAIDPKRLYDPAKWVGLTPEQIEERRKAGEGAGLLAKIHGERAKRVEDGRLPARESLEQIEKYKGYSDEQLKALGKQEREGRKTRLETLENAVRVTLEKNPRGARPEWMAEVRALDERLKGLRQPTEAKPAPTGRIIQHSQFGEVRESADQSGVAKGKLRVVDGEGTEHVIQNPRTSGNKNAAFAKSEKAETSAEKSEPLPPDAYAEARKRPDGKYQLFYRGTRNEVFPSEIFNSASEARQYLKVQRAKRDIARSSSEPKSTKPAESPAKPASDVDALLAAGTITPEQAAKMRRKPKISERREAPGAMPERYTGRQLFENARVQFRPARNRPATLVANDWGGAMMNRLLSEKYGESTTDANFTIAADDMQELRDYLAETKDSGIYDEAQTANMDALLGQIDAAIKDAKANNQDVAFVTRKAGEPISQTKIKVRHETAHVSQSRVTPDMFALTERDWLGKQPEAAAVRAELEQRGYPPETHAHESAVFVASGDFDAFGMNLDQATKFLSNYFKAVIQKHGRRALDRFGAIDPRLQPTLERARNEKTEAGQAANERRSVSYSPGTRRTGTAGTEAGRSNAGVLAGRREGAAGVPRISERKEGFSFGRLENEPEGQIAAAGLGAFQNLFGKKPDLSQPTPETKEAIPADFNMEQWRKRAFAEMFARRMPKAERKKYFDQFTPQAEKTALAKKYPPTDADVDAFADALSDAIAAYASGDGAMLREQLWRVRHITQPPATNSEKASALMRASMFSRPVGRLRDVISNAAFQKLETAARIPGGAADAFLSLITGRRAYLNVAPKMYLKHAQTDRAERWKQAKDVLKGKHTDSLEDILQHREVDFNNRLLDKSTKAIFRAMGAADHLYFVKAYRRALREFAEIQARQDVRDGIIGKADKEAQRDRYISAPSVDMKAMAEMSAKEAVFRNPNFVSDFIQKARENMPPGANFALDIVLPVDKTPTNIIFRALEYSPLGMAKAGGQAVLAAGRTARNTYRAARDRKGIPTKQEIQKALDDAFTVQQQRAMSQLIGRSLTGSSSLVALGFVLASKGMATGFYDEEDRKAEARRRAEGAQPGSIKILGRWWDLSGIAPMGTLITLGATLHREMEKEASSPEERYKRVAKGFADMVTDIPLLESAKTTAKIAKDATGKPAGMGRFAGNVVARFIPGFVGDIGQAIPGVHDPYEREVKAPKTDRGLRKAAGEFGREIGAKIPGVRRTLPIKRNAADEEMTTEYSDVIDPFRSRPAVPAASRRGFKGQIFDMGLDPQFSEAMQRKKGEPESVYQKRRERVEGWMNTYGEKLVSHPMYNLLTAEQKQKAIENLRDRVGKQMNRVSPDEEVLEPREVIKAVMKAATRKPRRGQEKMWEAEN